MLTLNFLTPAVTCTSDRDVGKTYLHRAFQEKSRGRVWVHPLLQGRDGKGTMRYHIQFQNYYRMLVGHLMCKGL